MAEQPESNSSTTFKIHPAIGIARLGNSDEFYLAPEQPGALPIECDADGVEQQNSDGAPIRVCTFKETADLSMVKRQAARFRIFAYQRDEEDSSQEIEVGGEYDFVVSSGVTAPTPVKGTVTDIQWTVHLANKKSSWYTFQQTAGSHGYEAGHTLRNPDVTEPNARRQLITDPGPQIVSLASPRAAFTKGENPGYPQTFPPEDIKPNPIKSLGELIANQQDGKPRMVVLGGRGNSGSSKNPVITSFVNNDGWFDDISDGPVSATILFTYPFEEVINGKKKVIQQSSSMQVQVPAWVVVGYPRFVPQMLDMVTLDEAMYDLFVQNFQYHPAIFGVAPYDKASNSPKTKEEKAIWLNDAGYNPDYYPKFYTEIWPMLRRPDLYQYTFDFDNFSGGDPHNTGTNGNLSQQALSQPPSASGDDPNLQLREFVYRIMRKPLENNLYFNTDKSKIDPSLKPRLMPMLCGNNPLSNTAADKFLTMTTTQLFFLQQWANGKFVNECGEWGANRPDCNNPWAEPPTTGVEIDRGVLSNMLGGAFCPGGELSWIVQNPALYSSAYRIKHTKYQAGGLSLPKPIAMKDGSASPDLAAGNEPGDLTKYIGIPWQADFHECTTQDIDITYEEWNNIDLDAAGDPAQQQTAYEIPWWPAHRPVIVRTANLNPKTGKVISNQVFWGSGIPENMAGDLEMVSQWNNLGFLAMATPEQPKFPTFYQIERNDTALGAPVTSGQGTLGRSKRSTPNDN
jgi:hypothetical protein